MSELVHVGLGANLGDAEATLAQALRALSVLPGTQLRCASSVYRSEPIDAHGPEYLNAVAELHSALAPDDLLTALQEIEQAHGRQRPYRNAPRTLDLDLLLYGSRVIHTARLKVPHPRLHERAFVLRPLFDLAPDVVVPGKGSVRSLLMGVADQRIQRLHRHLS